MIQKSYVWRHFAKINKTGNKDHFQPRDINGANVITRKYSALNIRKIREQSIFTTSLYYI